MSEEEWGSAGSAANAASAQSSRSSGGARQSVLLVIDVQTGLFHEDPPIHDGEALVARIRGLTDRARAAGVPVVYVQDNDVGVVGDAEWELHPELGARDGDLRMREAWGDSFFETPLESELRALGAQRLIIAGCQTDHCIDAGVRGAIGRGFDVTLVSDGHGACDNRFMTAVQSVEYFNGALKGLGAHDSIGQGKVAVTLAVAEAVEF